MSFTRATKQEFPMFLREQGDLFAVVSPIGASAFSSWGYTIWRGNECIAGARPMR